MKHMQEVYIYIYNDDVDKENKMSKDKFVNALKQRKIECLKSNEKLHMRNIVLKENRMGRYSEEYKQDHPML